MDFSSLTEMLFDSRDGAGQSVDRLAKRFGVSSDQARSAVRELAPELSRGLRDNVERPGGMDALVKALRTGGHDRYVDRPDDFDRDDTVQDGNKILGHLFGSKERSREVAGRAAEKTGLDSSILKKMLPMVATLVMGSMSKKTNSGGGGSAMDIIGGLLGGGGSSGRSGGLGGLLGGLGKLFGRG